METTSNGSTVLRSFDELWEMYDNPDYGDSVANSDIISVRTRILILRLCCIFAIIITFSQCRRFVVILTLGLTTINTPTNVTHCENYHRNTVLYSATIFSFKSQNEINYPTHLKYTLYLNIYIVLYMLCLKLP